MGRPAQNKQNRNKNNSTKRVQKDGWNAGTTNGAPPDRPTGHLDTCERDRERAEWEGRKIG